jgi:hypothetical protein
MSLSWILQRKRDGKWFFLSTAFNDLSAPVDETKAAQAGAFARSFLAKQP